MLIDFVSRCCILLTRSVYHHPAFRASNIPSVLIRFDPYGSKFLKCRFAIRTSRSTVISYDLIETFFSHWMFGEPI